MHIYTTNAGTCLNEIKHTNRNLLSQARSHTVNNQFYGDFVTSPHVEDNSKATVLVDLFENYNQDAPYCSDDIKLSYGSTL